MIALPDVNVLIALLDLNHPFFGSAQRWFQRSKASGRATCPITENGLLRILGNARYPGGPGSPAAAWPLLQHFRETAGHVFWPDDWSILSSPLVDVAAITSSAQLSDTYLVALAVSKGGRPATFDRRLKTEAVAGGAAAVELIGD